MQTVWSIYKDEYCTQEYAVGFLTKKDAIQYIDNNSDIRYADGGGVGNELDAEVSKLKVPSARKIVAYWSKYGRNKVNGRVSIKEIGKDEIEVCLYKKTLYPQDDWNHIDYDYSMEDTKEIILNVIKGDKVLRKPTKYAKGGNTNTYNYSIGGL